MPVQVKAHIRTTKSGKTAMVVSHSRDVEAAKSHPLAGHPRAIHLPKGTPLYHGTVEPFAGEKSPKLYPGGDGLVWFASTPSIAQLYLPHGANLYTNVGGLVRPDDDPSTIAIQKFIGIDYDMSKVSYDKYGRITSFPSPEGWDDLPTKEEITKRLRAKGIAVGDHGSVELRTGWDEDGTITVESSDPDGHLFIAKTTKDLVLWNKSEGESDLTDLQYNDIKGFKEAQAAGFDGVLIDDFAQSGEWGNLGHMSVGLFDSDGVSTRTVPAKYREFHHEDGTEDHPSPEVIKFRKLEALRKAEQIGMFATMPVPVKAHVRKTKGGKTAVVKQHPRKVKKSQASAGLEPVGLPGVSTLRGRIDVDKLRSIADGMQQRIDYGLHPASADQNWTPRRGRMAAGMYQDAERMQKTQAWLRVLADRAESGDIDVELHVVTSRAILDDLLYHEEHPSSMNTRTGHLANIIKDAPSHLKNEAGILSRWLTKAKRRKDARQFLPKLEWMALKAIIGSKTDGRSWWVAEHTLKQGGRAYKAGITTAKQWKEVRAALLKLSDEAKARSGTGDNRTSAQRALDSKVKALRGAKIPGFFNTPESVGQMMLSQADMRPGQALRVLEPSAGHGGLADLIETEYPDAKLDVIEINHTLREILTAKGYTLASRDFTAYDPGEVYDRIIMNPPFEKGQDVEHVRIAYKLLKPGGRLVAVASAGVQHNSQKKFTAFREWLDGKGWIQPLPQGSFKTSIRPTGVNTVLVIIDKDD